MKQTWNYDWKFTPEFTEAFVNFDYPEADLEVVQLPHTCKEVSFHYFDEHMYQMLCGYRKKLFAQKEWEGKPFLFHIEAAGHTSGLYVNGQLVKEHFCGYTAYTADLSSYLKYGEENVIAIRVDSREQQNVPPFGFVIDYMTFGGLYREVSYEVKEWNYLEDVFFKPQVTSIASDSKTGKANLCLEVALAKEAKDDMHLTVTGMEEEYRFKANKQGAYCIEDLEVKLWDGEHPHLYDLEVALWDGEKKIDTFSHSLGFRKAEFRADGFYLNDKKFKLRGLNRHQSYPYVGYAMPKSMQAFDAQILKKELGVNAVRTSHYPQSHHFLKECDRLGLLVFTEIPGWQHIGDEKWKEQAIVNTEDMILEYRNYTSIILWGVRINESADDDAFYEKTNEVAHRLDDTRPTGGVRAHKKSSLLEDVYTYNDFLHNGSTPGCEPKKKVTSDMKKAYLVSEYNGHMFPTKTFDCEEHRLEHTLRHARVLEAVASESDISGSFGWCMFDYNTHKDFGSGDRICYHGVMDMFRNPKMAALVYACQQEEEVVLEISSSMDIGEHPACNRGDTYIFSNADSVKMYKNGVFIKEYYPKDSKFTHLKHGPILIDDFIGNQLIENEKMDPKLAKQITYALNHTALHGYGNFPPKILAIMMKAILFHGFKMDDAVSFYTKYVGDWGGTSTVYRFEAIKNGKVVKSIVKEPTKEVHLQTELSAKKLVNAETYDVLAIRMKMVDQNQNVIPFYQESIKVEVEGPVELIGPSFVPMRGGMAGVYVKSIAGKEGTATVTFSNDQIGTQSVQIEVLAE